MLHFIHFFQQTQVLSVLNMLHTLRFSLQNAIYFIKLPILVPVLFTFYIQVCQNLNVKLRCQKVKKEKQRNRKSTTCAICWLNFVLHEEKRRTGSDIGRTNATKTVSEVFRHRSGTGKSYCRTWFDVGSERVKITVSWNMTSCSFVFITCCHVP
jgi:hypothetical protein